MNTKNENKNGVNVIYFSDVAGREHRRIGGQNLRANNHMMSPPAAPSPSSSSSVSQFKALMSAEGAAVI